MRINIYSQETLVKLLSAVVWVLLRVLPDWVALWILDTVVPDWVDYVRRAMRNQK